MKKSCLPELLLSSLIFTGIVHATTATITVPMQLMNTDGSATPIGEVTIEHAKCGILLRPNLHDLSPGLHGLHVHEKGNCGDQGMAAGGHYDPKKTGHHFGPYATQGHLGDLPALFVNQDGQATLPVLAPHLNLRELKGHALMVHAGGDNYSDTPEKLGGGGGRMACGVIK